jgi:hypothetical protein
VSLGALLRARGFVATEPRLVVAALVRNEADRFWRSALDAWSQFADEVVVLDDNSDDATPDLATAAGASVYFTNSELPMWGREASARAKLWEVALLHAEVGDFVFILDADMVPARDPRPLLASEPDAVAFVLYDLWTSEAYRDDSYWRGHLVPRVWLAKVPHAPAGGWVWPERGVHCGHFPSNLQFQRVVYAPRDMALLHHAYVTPELRARKHQQYLGLGDALSDVEWAHAASILSAPTLAPLPFTPDYTLRLANEA